MVRNEIIDILNAANTTTAGYDLSLGLDKRVTEVVKYDMLIKPEFKPNYPIVSVKLDLKNEVPEAFNNRRMCRTLDLIYHINCIYDSFKDGGRDAEENLWDLCRNVEVNLRAVPNLNSYSSDELSVNYCVISNLLPTEQVTKPGNKFNKVATVQFRVNCDLERMGELVWNDTTGAGDWARNTWDPEEF